MANTYTKADINYLKAIGVDTFDINVGDPIYEGDAALLSQRDPSKIGDRRGQQEAQMTRSSMDLSAPPMTGGGNIIPLEQVTKFIQTPEGAESIGAKITSDAGAPFVSPESAAYGAAKALGKDPLATPEVQASQDAQRTALSDGGVSQTPPAMAKIQSSLLDQISAGNVPSTDPFDGLSKNQKIMLAFAALRDAGAALQGKQGGAFEGLIGKFNDIRDMERKREIQRAELQARQQVLGSLGADPLGPNPTPEQIDAQIAKLTSILATNPSMAPYVTAELARLNPMRDRMVQAQNQLVSTQMGIAAADALIDSDKLNEIAGFTGTFNEWANKFGGAPEYATLMSYVNQLQGLNFLEAYQQLKGGGAITELEGKAAAASRSRLEAALKGTPEDLRLAVMDVKNLFEEARSKNPAYKKSGELSQDYKSWLQKKD